MDLSLLKPLSEILGVSVTEILNGEKIDEEIDLKSEEILIDTLDYSVKEIEKVKKNKFLIILLTIIITIFSIILLDTIQAVAFNAMDADALVMAAAVADYRPATVAADKVKKHDGEMNIALERTDDILAWVGAHKPEKLFVCGFSMETRDLIENSTAKLHKKNMDMIVANNLKVPGAGFGVDTNVVTIITAQGVTELPLQSKDAVAGHIADAIAGK